MNYDFDTLYDRLKTNSMKWNVERHDLPMWVADMDFRTAPEVTEAIVKRAEHGIYGYTEVPEEWYRAVAGWWKRRHNFQIEEEWLLFSTGVVPAISSIVRKLTTAGEKVLIQSPVYNIFYNSIVNNGRLVVSNDLILQADRYEIDFQDLEEKLSDPQVTLMILCNPHNPVGRIWSREELIKIAKLADKYQVLVVSDEIHCDLTSPGHTYVSYASVSEQARMNSITCISPTKAFNLAGLQTAAVCVANEYIRHKVWRALNTDEVAEPNVFAVEGAIAAFTKGEMWLEELRVYLAENRKITEAFIKEHLGELSVIPAEATYLAWISCQELTMNTEELCGFIRKETGLYVSAGGEYGENGKSFLRLNIACPRERLRDGLSRLKAGIALFRLSCPVTFDTGM